MKFIVSGATGYIGSHLSKKLLKLGHIVYGLSIDEERLNLMHSKDDNFIPILLDNSNFNKLPELINDKIDCFFHLSWTGVYGDSFKDYDLQMHNCIYSCDALEASIKLGCKKFILASTVDTLEVRNLINKNDEKNLRYANIYATSKLASEMIGKTIASKNESISFYSALIPTLYGEGNKTNSLIQLLIKNLIKGDKTNLIDYNTKFDIVYIDEVCEGLYYLINSKKKNETYFIGHEDPFIFGDLITHIRDIINKDGDIEFGKFDSKSEIDFNLINLKQLNQDTGCVLNKDKVDSYILKTYDWLKNNA